MLVLRKNYRNTTLLYFFRFKASPLQYHHQLYVCGSRFSIYRKPLAAFTLPHVLYGVFRYMYLVEIKPGGAPDETLLKDKPIDHLRLVRPHGRRHSRWRPQQRVPLNRPANHD